MKNVARLLSLTLACVALIASGSVLAADTIVIKGSTTVLPVAQAAAEAYMAKNPQTNISLSGGGSGNGIKALIDGSCDLATSSRFVKDTEIQLAVEKGVYPVPHRVAIDAIVPIVHPKNPVNDLTIEQLSLIYQGKITNWQEVGGPDLVIVVVSRDTSSGTYEVWEEKVLHKQRVTPKAQLQASNGAVGQAISNNRYAIGYIGYGYLNAGVKPLDVDGVKASVETALSGTYPVARPLFMFTNGWPIGATSSFLNYVVGPEGQAIVKDEGFIPLY